jgi:hypothetical protein
MFFWNLTLVSTEYWVLLIKEELDSIGEGECENNKN